MKNFIFRKYFFLKILFIFAASSVFLLMLRIKISRETYLLFLVWNLFLAFVPLLIAWLISLKRKKHLNIMLGCMWLLFLPNAPYIITDFIHLDNSPEGFELLDSFVIALFALTGLLMGVFSTLEIEKKLEDKLSKNVRQGLILLIHFLCAYGIYLGRNLRYNSWDIITSPKPLIVDVSNMFLAPLEHYRIWVFVVITGVFLHIIYNLNRIFIKNKLL